MLDILKVSPLALCIFYSRQGAEDAKVPPRTLLFCSLYTFALWREVLRGIVVARTSLSNFPYLTEDGQLVRNTAKMRQDETLTDVKI